MNSLYTTKVDNTLLQMDSKWPRLRMLGQHLFIIGYGLLNYATIRLLNDVQSGARFWLRDWQLNLIEIVGVLVTSYLSIYLLKYLLNRNLQLMPAGFSLRWSLREFGGVILALEGVSFVILLPLVAFTDDGAQWYDLVHIFLIPVLYGLLYYTIRRGDLLIRKSYEQQLQIEKVNSDRLQTELAMLKAQFHPHFLFNALNTVYFQIDDANADARNTVEQLSELLRYQLYDQDGPVELVREVEYLRAYIALQRQRMNEHLQLKVHMDEPKPTQHIHPMLLLPLIENAFKYVGGAYWMTIQLTVQDEKLSLLVENAVPLVDVQHLGSGIGLVNLRRRLDLLYPNRYRLQTERQSDMYKAFLELNYS